jgi:hypothetical protein
LVARRDGNVRGSPVTPRRLTGKARAMEIKTDVTLPFPRERVFVTYRDRLADLLPYLPNIRGLVVKSREDREGGEAYLVNVWSGGGEIPSVARAVVSESMLKWTDHATWRGRDFVCAWRTEVHAFPGALLSAGTNRFVEVGEGTRIEFRGDLTCDASRVPGVPRLLARTINGTVEKIFVGKIAENLAAVGKGIGKLLEKEGPA